jgi:dTDP-glucose 4,6-dehydratase
MISNGYSVITLDALTYAGSTENLRAHTDNPQHEFVEGSIADGTLVKNLLISREPWAIVNFAAETHVDRSIDGPAAFIESNIVGVFVLLEAFQHYVAMRDKTDYRFLHVSTDEVYGSAGNEAFHETSPYAPSSPYAASKAAADHLSRAWYKTYGLPTIITNCSNNYGPYQFPEKLIPLMTVKALHEEALPVYGNGKQRRDWLHVSDHCSALQTVLESGQPGETYNVGCGQDVENLYVVQCLCATLDRIRPRANGNSYFDLVQYVDDRPGHDLRYAVDASKLRSELGWQPKIDFETGLESTIVWYLENEDWIRAVRADYEGERLGKFSGVG